MDLHNFLKVLFLVCVIFSVYAAIYLYYKRNFEKTNWKKYLNILFDFVVIFTLIFLFILVLYLWNLKTFNLVLNYTKYIFIGPLIIVLMYFGMIFMSHFSSKLFYAFFGVNYSLSENIFKCFQKKNE